MFNQIEKNSQFKTPIFFSDPLNFISIAFHLTPQNELEAFNLYEEEWVLYHVNCNLKTKKYEFLKRIDYDFEDMTINDCIYLLNKFNKLSKNSEISNKYISEINSTFNNYINKLKEKSFLKKLKENFI